MTRIIVYLWFAVPLAYACGDVAEQPDAPLSTTNDTGPVDLQPLPGDHTESQPTPTETDEPTPPDVGGQEAPGDHAAAVPPSQGSSVFSNESGSRRAFGSYTVPVDADLKPFARFAVEVAWSEEQGEYRLSYDLPFELTGRTHHVSLRGGPTANGHIRLTGDLGTADCRPATTELGFICAERFFGLRFDLDRLARWLVREGASDMDHRLAVAEVFASDPIGVLTWSVR